MGRWFESTRARQRFPPRAFSFVQPFAVLSTFYFAGNAGDGYVRIELVPEPAAFGLFGLSLAGLSLIRRRRA